MALAPDERGELVTAVASIDPQVLRRLTADRPNDPGVECGVLTGASWPGAGQPLVAVTGDPAHRVLVDERCAITRLEPTHDRAIGAAVATRDGVLHVCHVSPAGELRYGMRRADGRFVFETVAPGVEGCALGVTADATVHVVGALANQTLAHWSRRASTTGWRQATLGEGVQPRVALGPDGSVHVVAMARGRPMYGTERTGTWRLEPIADGAPSSDAHLAVGGDGTVHVIVRLGADGDLRYARLEPTGRWRSETLGSGPVSQTTGGASFALALGRDGEPRVLFVREPSRLVALAERGSTPPAADALPFDAAFHLQRCARHTIGPTPQPSQAACVHLAESEHRARALADATRRCEAGDASMCFAQAIQASGHLPWVYRALLAPHEGTCRPGDVCRRTASHARHRALGTTAQSAAQASATFGAACERGSIQACLWHGAMLGQRDAAIAPLMRACLDGQLAGCVVPIDRLAPLHPDWQRAIDVLRGGCDRGDRIACASVATLSAEGLGRPRDLRAAAAAFASACGPLGAPSPEMEPTDLPDTLADDRFEIEPFDDRLYACAGLLTLANRERSVRRALAGSAAVVVVAGVCGAEGGEADGEACAALARALEIGSAGRRDRRRARLAREAACGLGHRASCPADDTSE